MDIVFWIVVVVVGFWVVVGLAAAYVTLFVENERRAKRAFEVLKHATKYGIGASAIGAIVTTVDKAGGLDLLHLVSR